MVIMQGPATTLPTKGIAQNCLILIFATAVAVAMAMPSVRPATSGGDGFHKYPSPHRRVPLWPDDHLPVAISDLCISSHHSSIKRTEATIRFG
jgi:hypothetical protein